jgi:DNA-binding response OmpR family regulator|tara:strand:- start:3421 stop:3657 length:237 start_codon:yes stop_codon:yes gene_type:complete
MDDDVSLSSSYFRDYSNKKNNIILSLFFAKAPRRVFSYARVYVTQISRNEGAKTNQAQILIKILRKKIERQKNTRKHY